MVQRRQWTEDELLVLTSIFFSGEFSIGDDAQQECQLIADAFSRTPSSVDRQWRNIADVLKQKEGVHVGKLVYQAVEMYLDNPAGVKRVATQICDQRGWQLAELVAAGETKASFEVAPDLVQKAFQAWMETAKLKLEYKIFSAGSHGFALEEKIPLTSGRSVLLTISCALIGSNREKLVDILAKSGDFHSSLRELIRRNPIKLLPTGRLTLQANKKYLICGQPFQMNLRLIELQPID